MDGVSTPRQIPPASFSGSLGYVFIHIPKCGGTSIHRALGALHAARAIPLLAQPWHKHAKAPEVRGILGDAWTKSFKFAFVRNPWDLMVSSYHWWLERGSRYPSLTHHASEVGAMDSFPKFIQSEYGTSMINEHRGSDLLEWLSDDHAFLVDFVGRVETIEADWKEICNRLAVTSTPLSIDNRIPREHYRVFYDRRSRDLVAARFAKTIEMFGYDF